ncbi:MAG: tRNA dihydrouridine synthase DusB [bacterium]
MLQKTQLEKNTLNIGQVKLESIVMIAPMAGITDTILRQIIRMFSKKCLLSSEMLSSEALKSSQNKSILDHNKIEYPLSFQISGHKPELMAEAARKLENISTIIDINMGCPVSKIVKNNEGAKLMTDLSLASKIISSVKKAVNIPVTIKCRLGWDFNSKNYIEFAKMAENSGADAIIVHARTKSQAYSGLADWHAVGEIKNSVNIPVIGNGDINSAQKALECLKISKCDGIAVGRGILGDPALIYRIEKYIDSGIILPELTIQERLDIALLHCKKEMEYRGGIHGIKFMRKFFGWYIKNIEEAAKYRRELVKFNTLTEIEDLFDQIKNSY